MMEFVVVYEMIRNGAKVADVVVLPNGKCVVSWPTSTVVYDSEESARAVHIDHMGGRGEKTQFIFVWASDDEVRRGLSDCVQDDCEGVPFASVGGLDARDDMRAPHYAKSPLAYLYGYRVAARLRYGADWQTCKFGFTLALTIPAPAEGLTEKEEE